METKNRYFHLEYFLTFLLFLPLLFLFPEEAAPLRIFLFGGIILGAAVAYISRNQLYSFRKIATLLASLFILAGTAYFVLKSTFLYREVIVICIKSLALLIVANSFSSCLQGCLNSMQIFSILLFLCVCALAKDYNNIFLALTSVFAFNLFAVARIKFYVIFNSLKKAREKDQGINVLFIIVLVLSALLAWILFTNLPLGKIKTWEYLKEEDLNSLEEQEKEKGTPLPEEQIQKELTQLTFKLSSTDEMHRVLAAIQDLLIKDKPFAYEVNKAQKDILEIINNQALVQDAEKGKELSDAIKTYTNKKISNNLTKIKNGVNKVIEDNHIGLRQRFALLSSLNKLEYSNSLEAIDRYGGQLQAAVNDPPIPDEAKKQLKQFDRQLKEWKAYQVYSRKFDSFQDKINTLDENKKQDFNALSQQINDVNTISDSSLVDKLIESMRRVSLPEDDRLIDEAEQILKLKKIMLASKENSQLRKRLEDSGQSVDKPPELEDALNAVEESRDTQEIVKKISKLLERMREDSYSQIPREAKELLEAKIESLIKDTADALKKQIRESKLPDSGESLLEGLKAMDSESAKGKIADISAEMQKALETFYRQGSITKEIKDSLIKETKKVEQLFIVRSELANMGKQEKSPDKNNPKDYKDKLTDLLQSLPLGNEQKERLKKLLDKLTAAQTVAQVEDALDALKQELEASTKKENTKDIDKLKELMQQAAEAKKILLENSSLGDEQKEQINKLMDKMANAKTAQQTEDALDALKQELEASTKKENTKDIDKLKELMQQAAENKKMFVVEKDSRSLREKVEDLKKALPQQAALLENNLDQIRESKNRQDLLKSTSALKELSESKQFEKKFEETDESLEVSENAQEGGGGIKIDLLPSYAVLPLKSSIPLKSVAIYDNFVKEVAPELEWSSSNPSVAFVNQFGVVYAKGIGEAEITCRYKETISRKCKVTVVEMISDPELVIIKNELEI